MDNFPRILTVMPLEEFIAMNRKQLQSKLSEVTSETGQPHIEKSYATHFVKNNSVA
jgi:hypothetical protein